MQDDKKKLSEEDICLRYVTPAIEAAGWDKAQIRRSYTLTAGRVIVRGKLQTRGEKKFADYVLLYKHGQPLAVVEAKDNTHSVGSGMQQAAARVRSTASDFLSKESRDRLPESLDRKTANDFRSIGIAGPKNGIAGPKFGIVGPKNGIVGPFIGIAGPFAGIVGPLIGIAGPFAGIVGPKNGIVGPFIGIAGPFNGIVGPKNGKRLPIDRMLESTDRMLVSTKRHAEAGQRRPGGVSEIHRLGVTLSLLGDRGKVVFHGAKRRSISIKY